MRLTETNHRLDQAIVHERQTHFDGRMHAESISLRDTILTQIEIGHEAGDAYVDAIGDRVESEPLLGWTALALHGCAIHLRHDGARLLEMLIQVVRHELSGRTLHVARAFGQAVGPAEASLPPFAQPPGGEAWRWFEPDIVVEGEVAARERLLLAEGLAQPLLRPAVAPEQFVAALAHQEDGYLLFARVLHDRPVAVARNVGDRVVCGTTELRKTFYHISRTALNLDQRNLEISGKAGRVRALVARGASLVAHTEGHEPRALWRRERRDRAGVEAARERHADGDIAPYDERCNFLEHTAHGGRGVCFEGSRVFQIPPPRCGHAPGRELHHHAVSRVELPHIRKRRARLGDPEKMEIVINRFVVERA